MWKVFLHIAMISIILFYLMKIITGDVTPDELVYFFGAVIIESYDIIKSRKKH